VLKDPYHLVILFDTTLFHLQAFQQYLTESKYRAYNPEDHTGNWRQLTVRTSQLDHLMIMADFNPQNLSEVLV